MIRTEPEQNQATPSSTSSSRRRSSFSHLVDEIRVQLRADIDDSESSDPYDRPLSNSHECINDPGLLSSIQSTLRAHKIITSEGAKVAIGNLLQPASTANGGPLLMDPRENSTPKPPRRVSDIVKIAAFDQGKDNGPQSSKRIDCNMSIYIDNESKRDLRPHHRREEEDATDEFDSTLRRLSSVGDIMPTRRRSSCARRFSIMSTTSTSTDASHHHPARRSSLGSLMHFIGGNDNDSSNGAINNESFTSLKTGPSFPRRRSSSSFGTLLAATLELPLDTANEIESVNSILEKKKEAQCSQRNHQDTCTSSSFSKIAFQYMGESILDLNCNSNDEEEYEDGAATGGLIVGFSHAFNSVRRRSSMASSACASAASAFRRRSSTASSVCASVVSSVASQRRSSVAGGG